MVLLDDLNGAMGDRAFDGITSQMCSAHAAAGDGFGCSWPAKFPVTRIDRILVRAVEQVAAGIEGLVHIFRLEVAPASGQRWSRIDRAAMPI
ncbi:hypothetical protein ACWGF2_37170 [Streptomyces sp. NPDC054919]